MLSDKELATIRETIRDDENKCVCGDHGDAHGQHVPRLLDEIARLNKVIFDWSDDLAAKGWDGDYDSLQKHSEEQQEEIERLRAALETISKGVDASLSDPARYAWCKGVAYNALALTPPSRTDEA